MKIIQSSVFRALVAVVVGVLLIEHTEAATKWLTISIGVLFFLSGLFSCIGYYYEKQRAERLRRELADTPDAPRPRMPFFPIVGVGSVFLGIILAVMPEDLILGVTYVLATMLILGAINQLVSLGKAHQYASIPLLFWLFPLVTLGVGILVFVRAKEASTLPLLIIGWCMVFYGVVECLNAIEVYRLRKHYEKEQEMRITQGEPIEDAEIVEE